MQVPTKLTPWPTRDSNRRLAGVSSFGISGTNAHLVLENFPAPPLKAGSASHRAQLLPLSAKSETALRQFAVRFAQHLEHHPEQELAAVCHTSAVGRSHYRQRLAVVGHTHEELSRQLRLFAGGGAETSTLIYGAATDEQLLSVAKQYVNGALPNWCDLLTGPPPRKVALPTYPFQREPQKGTKNL